MDDGCGFYAVQNDGVFEIETFRSLRALASNGINDVLIRFYSVSLRVYGRGILIFMIICAQHLKMILDL